MQTPSFLHWSSLLSLVSRIFASSFRGRVSWTCLSSLNVSRSPWIFLKKSLDIWHNCSDSTDQILQNCSASKLCICFKFKECWFPEDVLWFQQLQFFPALDITSAVSQSSPSQFFDSFLSWVLYFQMTRCILCPVHKVLYNPYWCYFVLQPDLSN